MKEYLSRDLILPELSCGDKESVLKEISAFIARATKLDENNILNTLKDREKLGSTGVGDGIAIPHGKMENLQKPLVSVARKSDGVDFESIDNKPVKILVTLLTPASDPACHLGLLARLTRILTSQDFKIKLLQAKDEDEIYRLFLDEDQKMIGLGVW